MEQFKKWMQIQDPNYNHKLCCIGAEEHGMKEGWRAALKWVKSKLECEVCPGDIEYFIDKELGGD